MVRDNSIDSLDFEVYSFAESNSSRINSVYRGLENSIHAYYFVLNQDKFDFDFADELSQLDSRLNRLNPEYREVLQIPRELLASRNITKQIYPKPRIETPEKLQDAENN